MVSLILQIFCPAGTKRNSLKSKINPVRDCIFIEKISNKINKSRQGRHIYREKWLRHLGCCHGTTMTALLNFSDIKPALSEERSATTNIRFSRDSHDKTCDLLGGFLFIFKEFFWLNHYRIF